MYSLLLAAIIIAIAICCHRRNLLTWHKPLGNDAFSVGPYTSLRHRYQNYVTCRKLRKELRAQRQWASVVCAYRVGQVMAGKEQAQ